MRDDYISVKNEKGSDELKILISMHSVDRCIYLERLINGITQSISCTVCYSPFPADGMNTDLSGIDLVIAGVTEKYITWSNSGFVSEVLPALSAEVPVLPVMLEKGIVNLFNTRVGKLHYIESVGQELSQEALGQINSYILSLGSNDNAFGDKRKPGIFISYRKRDINELQRFIALIDAHPERERVCLWYDTGLKPGDNYQLTIEERLKSCDLFLMLVTPNVLEPDNYVMRVEYPMAVKEKKHILPVIMQKTDLNELYRLFPGLPKCVTDTQTGAIFSKIRTSE